MAPAHPLPSPSLDCANARPRQFLTVLLGLLLLSLNAPAAPVPGLPALQRVRTWSLLDGLPDSRIKSLVRTRVGDLWFGTREGLVRFHADTFSIYTITNAPALRNPEVSRIVEDSEGGLWLATPSGVVHWHDEQFERLDPNDVPDFAVNAILPESRSGLWIGGGYMLARFHQGTWTRHTQETGLRDADINSLAEHPDGTLWIGCHRGLLHFDPYTEQFSPVDMPGAFEQYHVQAITFAADGTAWILTHTRAEGHCRLWHFSNGRWIDRTRMNNPFGDRLLLASFAQPAAFWNVSAAWGLERWVDPSSQELIPPPPSQRDPAWSLCDDGHGNLWVGTLSGGLELWRTADNSAAIPFAHVGTPHTSRTTLVPIIAATTVTAAASLMASMAFYRRRVARLRAESADRLDAERQKIASRIHDHIGSQMTELTLLAARADGEPSGGAALPDSRQAFSKSAHQLSQALRDSMWETHAADTTFDGLIQHLGDHAHTFLRAAGIRCRLAFPDEPLEIPLQPRVRQEVFLAAKEALHNVVRHAAASEVHLRAAMRNDQLEIEIRDNGVGFGMSPAREDSTGQGLPSMQRRLRSLGGNCRVISQAGMGTRVLLELPLTSTSQN